MSDPLKSRKLRPLMEAFNASNYRNVLRISAQRDLATNTAAQVIRAQTLSIVGQRPEALDIISSIMGNVKPSDEDLIERISEVLIKAKDFLTMSSFFDGLSKKVSSPTECILKGQFFAKFLNQDYSGAQKVAIQLSKVVGPKYFLWVATTMLTNSMHSGNSSTLALAEMMARRGITEEQLTDYESVGMLVRVLVETGKVDEAIALLEGELSRDSLLEKKKAARDAPKTPASESKEVQGDDKEDAEEEKFASIDIDHPDPGLMSEAEYLRELLHLKWKKEDWAAVNELCKELLCNHDMDDWAYWLSFVYSSFILAKNVEGVALDPESTDDSAIKNLLNMVDKAHKDNVAKKSRALRGPQLARILTLSVAFELSPPTPVQQGEYVNTVAEFAQQFRSKPSTFFDLKNFLLPAVREKQGASTPWNRVSFPCPVVTPYFLGRSSTAPLPTWKLSVEAGAKMIECVLSQATESVLTEEDLKRINSALGPLKEIPPEEQEVAPEQKQCLSEMRAKLRHYLNSIEILQYLNANQVPTTTGVSSSVEGIDYLLRLYEDTALLSVDSLGGDSEFKANDEILVFAGRVLLTAAQSTLQAPQSQNEKSRWNVRHYLMCALTIVEKGLANSPNNYHLMGLKAQLATALGMPRTLAVTVVEDMRVKHVQYYSMAYLLIPYLLHYGRFRELHEICWHINTMVDSRSSLAEFSRKAFMKGHFSKVLDFAHFGNRVEKSFYSFTANHIGGYFNLPLRSITEMHSALKHGIMTGNAPLTEISDKEMNSLIDNSDHNALISWTGPIHPSFSDAAPDRRNALTQRMQMMVLAQKILLSLLDGQLSSASEKLKALKDKQAPEVLSFGWVNDSSNGDEEKKMESETDFLVPQVLLGRCRTSLLHAAWKAMCTAFEVAIAFAESSSNQSANWASIGDQVERLRGTLADLFEVLLQHGYQSPTQREGITINTKSGKKGGKGESKNSGETRPLDPAFLAEVAALQFWPLHFVPLLLGVSVKNAPKLKKAKGKKKGKGGSAATDKSLIACLKTLETTVDSFASTLSGLEKWCSRAIDAAKEGKLDSSSLESHMQSSPAICSLPKEELAKTIQLVHHDHQECLDQFKSVLKDRVSFLRGLKL